MRSVLLALILTFVAPLASAVADKAPPKEAAKGDEFPLPKDASTPSAAPGGGGKIQVYEVPRKTDAVLTEVRAALKAGGWEITKDEKSPSGRALRLEVKKGTTIIKASFTGDGERTAIILTLP